MSIKEKLDLEAAGVQHWQSAEQAIINGVKKVELESLASKRAREARMVVVEKKIAEIVNRSQIREVFSEAAKLTKGEIADDLSTPHAPEARLAKKDAEKWLTEHHEKGYEKTISLMWTAYGPDNIRDVIRPGLLDRAARFIKNEDYEFELSISAHVNIKGIRIGLRDRIRIPEAYDKDVLERAVLTALRSPYESEGSQIFDISG